MTSPIIEDLKALMEDWSKSNNPLHGECFRYRAADLRAIIEKHEASAEGARVDELLDKADQFLANFNDPQPHPSISLILELIAALLHQQAAQVAAVPDDVAKDAARWRQYAERKFPIQNAPDIPWRVIEPHHKQAETNHGQTLERLAQRGGLSPCEAIAVLEDRRWQKMDYPAANLRLLEIVAAASPEPPSP